MKIGCWRVLDALQLFLHLSSVLQYTKLTSVLEMLPESVGKGGAVSTLTFTSDGSTLALGGASPSIRLHNYDSVLNGGTRCALLLWTCMLYEFCHVTIISACVTLCDASHKMFRFVVSDSLSVSAAKNMHIFSKDVPRLPKHTCRVHTPLRKIRTGMYCELQSPLDITVTCVPKPR
jgi:hypothetical protein